MQVLSKTVVMFKHSIQKLSQKLLTPMWDSFNFDDTGISLLVFLSRTNLKADDNYVTCKKVKKFIIVLDFLKAFIRYFILLAALRKVFCKVPMF